MKPIAGGTKAVSVAVPPFLALFPSLVGLSFSLSLTSNLFHYFPPLLGEFKFEGQAHYEKLGQFVGLSLQDKIQEEFDLERVIMPSEKHRDTCPVSFPIFHSKDIARNPKLVVLVLGAGKVELGQWSRSLCMNKSLAEGSLLPFLHEAIRVRGCAVLLTNPNINTYLDPVLKTLRRIPGHGSPEDHLYSLYHRYIAGSVAKEVSIIAHSFGGVSTMTLLSRPNVVADLVDSGRLKSITFTDSVHSAFLGQYKIGKPLKKWLLNNAINFVRSKDPLGEEYLAQSYTQRQSAGTDDHASTSYFCRSLLWKWVDERMTKEALPLVPESEASAATGVDSSSEVEEEDALEVADDQDANRKQERRSKRLQKSRELREAGSSSAHSSENTKPVAEDQVEEVPRPKKRGSKKRAHVEETPAEATSAAPNDAEESGTSSSGTKKAKTKEHESEERIPKQKKRSAKESEEKDSDAAASSDGPSEPEAVENPKKRTRKA